MDMTVAAALLRKSANTHTSRSHLTTRRRVTKMSRRVSRREARLHRRRPCLAPELQRPMRAHEVVVAPQQLEMRLERVLHARMGERPS